MQSCKTLLQRSQIHQLKKEYFDKMKLKRKKKFIKSISATYRDFSKRDSWLNGLTLGNPVLRTGLELILSSGSAEGGNGLCLLKELLIQLIINNAPVLNKT